MAVGKLVVELYLIDLPEGWEFTITNIEDKSSQNEDGWYATETWGHKIKSKKVLGKTTYTTEAPKEGDKILILESMISNDRTNFPAAVGNGTSRTYHFTVGDPKHRGQWKNGAITMSATEWPSLGRPDYSLLSYVFAGSPPQEISQQLPYFKDPEGYFISFKKDKANKLYMIVAREDEEINSIIEEVLQNVVYGAKKAVSWVVETLLFV